MVKWPAISMSIMSLLICLAADYGLQSRLAGMSAGDLSLDQYAATVRGRIFDDADADASARNLAAASGGLFISSGEQVEVSELPQVRVNKGLGGGSAGTCVRRATSLDCK